MLMALAKMAGDVDDEAKASLLEEPDQETFVDAAELKELEESEIGRRVLMAHDARSEEGEDEDDKEKDEKKEDEEKKDDEKKGDEEEDDEEDGP